MHNGAQGGMYDEDLATRLLATFLDELDEQLRVLSSDLLVLEAQPGDEERLRSVFRIFHTLKGASRAADVPLIEGVSHRLEGLLAAARDGKTPLTPVQLDVLFRAASAFEDAGRRIRSHDDLADSRLAALDRQLRGGVSSSPVSSSPPLPTPAPAHNASPVIATPVAPAVSEITVSAPVEQSAPVVMDTHEHEQVDEQVRVGVYRIDAMIDAAGEVVTLAGAISDRQREAAALQATLTRGRSAWRGLLQRRLDARLDLEGRAALRTVLDALDDEIRQVTREGAQLTQALARDADRLASTAGPLLRETRELRLRPISDITASLQRTVRELSRTLGKPVRLELIGEKVEADRTVLDRLREPLLHLVRNAIDHGIETPAERAEQHKPPEATVTISAAAAGDSLTITVADDGRGLDLDAIRARLVQQRRPVPTDPAALAATLFEGGFSTRAAATEISGRGVGLDVVRTQVEQLGGSVELHWERHSGTRFSLRVPLTLASLRVVLVSVGEQTLAIPTAAIEHLRRVGPNDVRQIEGRSFMVTNSARDNSSRLAVDGGDAPIPIASLAALLGPPLVERGGDGKGNGNGNAMRRVVQIASQGSRLAVVVDDLLDEREVMVRPLEHSARSVSLLSGGALLPTGEVALLVNVPAVIATATGQSRLGALQAPVQMSTARNEQEHEHRRATVLVVDDSVTTRTLEESVLRAAGYHVVTATDGADAWRMLQASPMDLVISDVEMPRMDGIQLCEAVKASASLRSIPIILVTSLDRPEQIQRGLAAGADAYLPKSSFDQDTLLDMIHQLLGDGA
ncbi:MAG: hybrid sensor histidine kinase/response regulator [Gemmatimonadaceae bacterium]